MVSGSCACTSITNPKSVGRFPLISRHVSPASSERITSQCLHEQHVRPRWVQRDTMYAVADFGGGIRDVLRPQAAVDRFPRLAGIVRAESARRRNGDEDPFGIAGIEQDRVQAHAA